MAVISRRFIIVWLLGCLLLQAAGCAPRFSFVVTGDMRQFTPPEHAGPAYFAGVCEAIRATGPGSFMISPGDIDPPDRVRATVDDVLGKDYPWYPVVGNHDIERPQDTAWLRAYNAGGHKLPRVVRSGPPGAVETCYSFDHQNAHFVVLNEYYDGQTDAAKPGRISDALYRWLEADLAATHKALIFVIAHEPYQPTADMDTGVLRHMGQSLDRDPEGSRRFWMLLCQHNVAAYICGHTHTSSVRKIEAVWQLDSGHARGLGEGKKEPAPSTFLAIRVLGSRVDCDMYRAVTPGEPTYKLARTQRLR